MTKIFLKNLTIENLILVSKTSIDFERGFTVISGETGSGKSSLLYALKLALGERGDPEKIREGSDKGKVTALFEVEGSLPFLRDVGIEVDDTLVITREISKTGKSRAFINHEPVQVHLLKELGRYLISTLDQGSSLILKEEKEQLHFLDLAAKNGPFLKQYKEACLQLKEGEKDLEKLLKLSQEREREKAILEREKEEISSAELKEGEEEELFQEYRRLTTAEERRTLLGKCQRALTGTTELLHPRLRDIEQLKELDPSLSEDLKSLSTILLECTELRSTLERSLGSLEIDEERLQALTERLDLIEKLKKRFGNSIEAVLTTLSQIEERLSVLEGLDEAILERKDKFSLQQEKVRELRELLTSRRQKTIPLFESQVEELLEELNFPQVQFKVRLEGDEKASFWLAPNVGEKMVPVSGGVSGGEMARLLLALLILLHHEEGRIVLLFDEMDAHIGGTTAAKIGEKLKSLAEEHQVIAITHFPQVAEAADHHIAIGKKVEGERTIATITSLTPEERELELLRMSGESLIAVH